METGIGLALIVGIIYSSYKGIAWSIMSFSEEGTEQYKKLREELLEDDFKLLLFLYISIGFTAFIFQACYQGLLALPCSYFGTA